MKFQTPDFLEIRFLTRKLNCAGQNGTKRRIYKLNM
ncbi:hypothetical protein A2U01_0073075, partial [Trifolium medium]|nr:hypothetical protein [Trifolium medium]